MDMLPCSALRIKAGVQHMLRCPAAYKHNKCPASASAGWRPWLEQKPACGPLLHFSYDDDDDDDGDLTKVNPAIWSVSHHLPLTIYNLANRTGIFILRQTASGWDICNRYTWGRSHFPKWRSFRGFDLGSEAQSRPPWSIMLWIICKVSS